METIWPIVAAIEGALAAWAGALVSLSNPNYRFARQLFWASALILGVTDLAWEFTTDKPIWFQIGAGVLTTIAICVVFPMLLAWTHEKQQSAPPHMG
ncbi:MAG TPA: hypothetical protein VIJ42_18225 [Stellaceae bacterium]